MRLHPSIVGSLALVTTLAAGCTPQPVGAAAGAFPGSTSTTSTSAATTGTDAGVLGNGATYAGVYNANAQLDFTQPGVLPGIVSPALAALSEVGSDPGDALVNLAQAAGAIDLDSTTRSIIGSVISQELENVMSSDVQQALQSISAITSITKTSTLQNSLTIHTPSSNGSVQVDIAVKGVAFDFVNIDGTAQHVVVQTSPTILAAATSTLTGTLTPHGNAPVADADLTFSGGTLALPIGDWMQQALGPLVFEPEWGTSNLQTTLTQLMSESCAELGPALEQDVEDLTSLDIGSELGTTICTTAVQLAATEITTAIDKLTVSGVTITSGQVGLFDVSTAHPTADHQTDLLSNGTWTWSLDSVSVPATVLDGTRTASAI